MTSSIPSDSLKNLVLEETVWDEVTDPLPDTWDELVKEFSDKGQCDGLDVLRSAVTPHPKVIAFKRRGGKRLREALEESPFWAEGALKAMELGGQARVDQYWEGLFMNERNLYRPPKTTKS